MKAKFTGSQEEFDEFYLRLRKEQSASNKQVVFMFEVEKNNEVIKGVENLSFSNDDDLNYENVDESDIFHPNNREWLSGKLAEADEEINAGNVVPSSKALFEDVISRGKARLGEAGK